EEEGSCAGEALSFFDSFVSRVAETGVAFLLASGSLPLSLDLERAEAVSSPPWRAFIRSATVPLVIGGGFDMISRDDEDLPPAAALESTCSSLRWSSFAFLSGL